eukprot:TRINITY_DN395_c0_g1_i3.p2 TRINITY_DN395_c0_g1~~TRINITY_DN395_c0_g1_i3.p2  ORF type:complete len:4733 (+),score=1367.82 TRINITY_DN395_c0_g1_i3:16265-30463(+)
MTDAVSELEGMQQSKVMEAIESLQQLTDKEKLQEEVDFLVASSSQLPKSVSESLSAKLEQMGMLEAAEKIRQLPTIPDADPTQLAASIASGATKSEIEAQINALASQNLPITQQALNTLKKQLISSHHSDLIKNLDTIPIILESVGDASVLKNILSEANPDKELVLRELLKLKESGAVQGSDVTEIKNLMRAHGELMSSSEITELLESLPVVTTASTDSLQKRLQSDDCTEQEAIHLLEELIETGDPISKRDYDLLSSRFDSLQFPEASKLLATASVSQFAESQQLPASVSHLRNIISEQRSEKDVLKALQGIADCKMPLLKSDSEQLSNTLASLCYDDASNLLKSIPTIGESQLTDTTSLWGLLNSEDPAKDDILKELQNITTTGRPLTDDEVDQLRKKLEPLKLSECNQLLGSIPVLLQPNTVQKAIQSGSQTDVINILKELVDSSKPLLKSDSEQLSNTLASLCYDDASNLLKSIPTIGESQLTDTTSLWGLLNSEDPAKDDILKELQNITTTGKPLIDDEKDQLRNKLTASDSDEAVKVLQTIESVVKPYSVWEVLESQSSEADVLKALQNMIDDKQSLSQNEVTELTKRLQSLGYSQAVDKLSEVTTSDEAADNLHRLQQLLKADDDQALKEELNSIIQSGKSLPAEVIEKLRSQLEKHNLQDELQLLKEVIVSDQQNVASDSDIKALEQAITNSGIDGETLKEIVNMLIRDNVSIDSELRDDLTRKLRAVGMEELALQVSNIPLRDTTTVANLDEVLSLTSTVEQDPIKTISSLIESSNGLLTKTEIADLQQRLRSQNLHTEADLLAAIKPMSDSAIQLRELTASNTIGSVKDQLETLIETGAVISPELKADLEQKLKETNNTECLELLSKVPISSTDSLKTLMSITDQFQQESEESKEAIPKDILKGVVESMLSQEGAMLLDPVAVKNVIEQLRENGLDELADELDSKILHANTTVAKKDQLNEMSSIATVLRIASDPLTALEALSANVDDIRRQQEIGKNAPPEDVLKVHQSALSIAGKNPKLSGFMQALVQNQLPTSPDASLLPGSVSSPMRARGQNSAQMMVSTLEKVAGYRDTPPQVGCELRAICDRMTSFDDVYSLTESDRCILRDVVFLDHTVISVLKVLLHSILLASTPEDAAIAARSLTIGAHRYLSNTLLSNDVIQLLSYIGSVPFDPLDHSDLLIQLPRKSALLLVETWCYCRTSASLTSIIDELKSDNSKASDEFAASLEIALNSALPGRGSELQCVLSQLIASNGALINDTRHGDTLREISDKNEKILSNMTADRTPTAKDSPIEESTTKAAYILQEIGSAASERQLTTIRNAICRHPAAPSEETIHKIGNDCSSHQLVSQLSIMNPLYERIHVLAASQSSTSTLIDVDEQLFTLQAELSFGPGIIENSAIYIQNLSESGIEDSKLASMKKFLDIIHPELPTVTSDLPMFAKKRRVGILVGYLLSKWIQTGDVLFEKQHTDPIMISTKMEMVTLRLFNSEDNTLSKESLETAIQNIHSETWTGPGAGIHNCRRVSAGCTELNTDATFDPDVLLLWASVTLQTACSLPPNSICSEALKKAAAELYSAHKLVLNSANGLAGAAILRAGTIARGGVEAHISCDAGNYKSASVVTPNTDSSIMLSQPPSLILRRQVHSLVGRYCSLRSPPLYTAAVNLIVPNSSIDESTLASDIRNLYAKPNTECELMVCHKLLTESLNSSDISNTLTTTIDMLVDGLLKTLSEKTADSVCGHLSSEYLPQTLMGLNVNDGSQSLSAAEKIKQKVMSEILTPIATSIEVSDLMLSIAIGDLPQSELVPEKLTALINKLPLRTGRTAHVVVDILSQIKDDEDEDSPLFSDLRSAAFVASGRGIGTKLQPREAILRLATQIRSGQFRTREDLHQAVSELTTLYPDHSDTLNRMLQSDIEGTPALVSKQETTQQIQKIASVLEQRFGKNGPTAPLVAQIRSGDFETVEEVQVAVNELIESNPHHEELKTLHDVSKLHEMESIATIIEANCGRSGPTADLVKNIREGKITSIEEIQQEADAIVALNPSYSSSLTNLQNQYDQHQHRLDMIEYITTHVHSDPEATRKLVKQIESGELTTTKDVESAAADLGLNEFYDLDQKMKSQKQIEALAETVEQHHSKLASDMRSGKFTSVKDAEEAAASVGAVLKEDMSVYAKYLEDECGTSDGVLASLSAQIQNSDKDPVELRGLSGQCRALASQRPELSALLSSTADYLDQKGDHLAEASSPTRDSRPPADIIETIRTVLLHPKLPSNVNSELYNTMTAVDTAIQQAGIKAADSLRDPDIDDGTRRKVLHALSQIESGTPASVIADTVKNVGVEKFDDQHGIILNALQNATEVSKKIGTTTDDDTPEEVQRALLEAYSCDAVAGFIKNKISKDEDNIPSEQHQLLQHALGLGRDGRGGEMVCIAENVLSDDDDFIKLKEDLSSNFKTKLKLAEDDLSTALANNNEIQGQLEVSIAENESNKALLTASNDSLSRLQLLNDVQLQSRAEDAEEQQQKLKELEDSCCVLERQLQEMDTVNGNLELEAADLRQQLSKHNIEADNVKRRTELLVGTMHTVQNQVGVPIAVKEQLTHALVNTQLAELEQVAVEVLSDDNLDPATKEILLNAINTQRLSETEETLQQKQERLVTLRDTLTGRCGVELNEQLHQQQQHLQPPANKDFDKLSYTVKQLLQSEQSSEVLPPAVREALSDGLAHHENRMSTFGIATDVVEEDEDGQSDKTSTDDDSDPLDNLAMKLSETAEQLLSGHIDTSKAEQTLKGVTMSLREAGEHSIAVRIGDAFGKPVTEMIHTLNSVASTSDLHGGDSSASTDMGQHPVFQLMSELGVLEHRIRRGDKIPSRYIERLQDHALSASGYGPSMAETSAILSSIGCKRSSKDDTTDNTILSELIMSSARRHPEISTSMTEANQNLKKGNLVEASQIASDSVANLRNIRILAAECVELQRRSDLGEKGDDFESSLVRLIEDLNAHNPNERNSKLTTAADRLQQRDLAAAVAALESAAGCGGLSVPEVSKRLCAASLALRGKLSALSNGETVPVAVNSAISNLNAEVLAASRAMPQHCAASELLRLCSGYLHSASSDKSCEKSPCESNLKKAEAAARSAAEVQSGSLRASEIVNNAVRKMMSSEDDVNLTDIQNMISDALSSTKAAAAAVPEDTNAAASLNEIADGLSKLQLSSEEHLPITILEADMLASQLRKLAANPGGEEVAARMVATRINEIKNGILFPQRHTSPEDVLVNSRAISGPSASEEKVLGLLKSMRDKLQSHQESSISTTDIHELQTSAAKVAAMNQTGVVVGVMRNDVDQKLTDAACSALSGEPAEAREHVQAALAACEAAALVSGQARLTANNLWSIESRAASGSYPPASEMQQLSEKMVTVTNKLEAAGGTSNKNLTALNDGLGAAAESSSRGRNIQADELCVLRDSAAHVAGLPVRDSVAAATQDLSSMLTSLVAGMDANGLNESISAEDIRKMQVLTQQAADRKPEVKKRLASLITTIDSMASERTTGKDLLALQSDLRNTSVADSNRHFTIDKETQCPDREWTTADTLNSTLMSRELLGRTDIESEENVEFSQLLRTSLTSIEEGHHRILTQHNNLVKDDYINMLEPRERFSIENDELIEYQSILSEFNAITAIETANLSVVLKDLNEDTLINKEEVLSRLSIISDEQTSYIDILSQLKNIATTTYEQNTSTLLQTLLKTFNELDEPHHRELIISEEASDFQKLQSDFIPSTLNELSSIVNHLKSVNESRLTDSDEPHERMQLCNEESNTFQDIQEEYKSKLLSQYEQKHVSDQIHNFTELEQSESLSRQQIISEECEELFQIIKSVESLLSLKHQDLVTSNRVVGSELLQQQQQSGRHDIETDQAAAVADILSFNTQKLSKQFTDLVGYCSTTSLDLILTKEDTERNLIEAEESACHSQILTDIQSLLKSNFTNVVTFVKAELSEKLHSEHSDATVAIRLEEQQLFDRFGDELYLTTLESERRYEIELEYLNTLTSATVSEVSQGMQKSSEIHQLQEEKVELQRLLHDNSLAHEDERKHLEQELEEKVTLGDELMVKTTENKDLADSLAQCKARLDSTIETVDKIRESYDKKEEENLILRDTVEDSKRRLDEATETLERVQQDYKTKESELNNLQSEYDQYIIDTTKVSDDLRNTKAELVTKVETLQTEATTSTQRADQLQKENSTLITEKIETEEVVTKLKEDNQTSVQRADRESTALRESTAKVDVLEKENQELVTRQAAIEQEVVDLNNKNEALQKESERAEELEKENKTLITKISDTQNELESTKQQHQQASDTLTAENSELVTKQAALQQQLDDLNQKNAKALEDIEQATTQLAELKKEKDELIAKHNTAQQEYDSLKKQSLEKEELTATTTSKADQLEKENSALVSKHADTQQELDDTKEKVQQHTTKVASLEQTLREEGAKNDELQKQNIALTTKQAETQQALEDATSQISDLQKENTDNNQKLQKLNEETSESIRRADRDTDTIKQLQETITALEDQNKTIHSSQQQHADQLSQATQERDAAIKKAALLDTETKTSSKQIEELQSENKKLQESTQTEMEKLSDINKKLEDEKQIAVEQLTTLQSDSITTNEKLKTVTTEKDELLNKLSESETANRTLAENESSLKQQLEEQQAKQETLRQQLSNADVKASTETEAVAQLTKEKADLETEKQVLVEQLSQSRDIQAQMRASQNNSRHQNL